MTAVAAGALGTVIRSFKASVTRAFRRLHPAHPGPVWQANYFEHVVRDLRGVERVREYIRANPERWALDRENERRSGRDPFDVWLDGEHGATPGASDQTDQTDQA
ncbi:MAG: hypothetical protein KIT58_11780 [Planctomycetota bacterium]|nr:hypothetical protein [Planctomycetota bacterium]